jgi:hypothetical protein
VLAVNAPTGGKHRRRVAFPSLKGDRDDAPKFGAAEERFAGVPGTRRAPAAARVPQGPSH